MFVTDLKVELSKASAFVAVEGVRSLLTTAKATTDRVDEEPFATEDGRQVALASGVSDLGYCAAAAHVWPGTILLLSLFQGDGDVKVRRDARSIFLSVRRREAAGPRKSRLARLLGR